MVVYPQDGYYSTIKMNKLDTHSKLDDSQMLSERSQKKKSVVHALLFPSENTLENVNWSAVTEKSCGCLGRAAHGRRRRSVDHRGHEETWSRYVHHRGCGDRLMGVYADKWTVYLKNTQPIVCWLYLNKVVSKYFGLCCILEKSFVSGQLLYQHALAI